jgi:hypothetical protein
MKSISAERFLDLEAQVDDEEEVEEEGEEDMSTYS